MAFYISRARLALITVVGAISIIAGLMLIFRLGTPRNLERLHTWEIVAMLGLLVLPALTVWAFYADVRARRAEMLSDALHFPASERAEPLHADRLPASTESRLHAGRDCANEKPHSASVRHPRPGDDQPREDHRRLTRRTYVGPECSRADSKI